MELGALGQDGELDIFSNYEFAKHNYDLNRILKLKKFLHLVDRTRIVQLKMKRSTLRKLAKKVSSEHNVIKFCTNIIDAHRCGAFDKKLVLCNLFYDVV